MVVVSSDKAVEPTTTYGATKMMAEHLTTQFNAISYPQGMRCSVVRFGNLWHSHGSVIDLWMEAAQAGHDLLLTDPAMTRFILTLTQAVDFVLAALAVVVLPEARNTVGMAESAKAVPVDVQINYVSGGGAATLALVRFLGVAMWPPML